jgi:hypothetical protein
MIITEINKPKIAKAVVEWAIIALDTKSDYNNIARFINKRSSYEWVLSRSFLFDDLTEKLEGGAFELAGFLENYHRNYIYWLIETSDTKIHRFVSDNLKMTAKEIRNRRNTYIDALDWLTSGFEHQLDLYRNRES